MVCGKVWVSADSGDMFEKIGEIKTGRLQFVVSWALISREFIFVTTENSLFLLQTVLCHFHYYFFET